MQVPHDLHSWQVSPREAVQIQKQLRSQIRLQAFHGPLRYIAGADISFNKYSPTVYAGFVVLAFPSMSIVERAGAVVDVSFPYVPGLLSFREIPPLMQAWRSLQYEPDVIVVDGHGIAHPRRLGIATHFGLLVNKPTMGCGKSRLTGEYTAPGLMAGESSPLRDGDETIGLVLRTKTKVNPVFVSPGHMMDIASAASILMQSVRGYRLPEPTRQAHLYVNELRRQHMPASSEREMS